MEFHLYHVKNRETWWIDAAFYVAAALLAVAIFCYCILAIKIYFQDQNIDVIRESIVQYGTAENKQQEKTVLEYKKKIDDFSLIFANHKLSSSILGFLEANTLSDVWFSNFDMAQDIDTLRLSGEANDAQVVSRQLAILEEKKDYVHKVTMLKAQSITGKAGKVVFLVDIALNPNMFSYGNQ